MPGGGMPDFEVDAAKCSRKSRITISHHIMSQAMRATGTMLGDRHTREIALTAILSGQQVVNAIPVEDIIGLLNSAKIRFVLAGAHGMAGWRDRARATEAVDLVVMAKHVKKATKLLVAAYAHLDAEDHEVVVRLRDRGTQKVAVDLMKTNQPLYAAAFQHAIATTIKGRSCLIPTLEMSLAMKFAPMISLTREDDKKHIDASDFIRMVNVNAAIDLETLAELGDLVYPGGGKEIVEKVRQVRAGGRLRL
jgi:hypothetical protein